MHHGSSTHADESSVIPLRARVLPEITAAPVDLNDLNSPHTLAVLSIPPGATVLDIGCGPGAVARALASRGCKVWGLELDPRRAASARNYCVEVLEVDAEAIDLSNAFPDMAFDAVLFLDVLEHLREPQAALANAAAALAPGGSVLISIPNVTHGALRLELLAGKFRYRSSGLLDRGHLRFFDAEAVDELIRQAGFRAETRLRVLRQLDQTEFDIDLASIPSTLRSALETDVDALTYQFFVIAKPVGGLQLATEGISLVERQRARIDELTAGLDKGGAYARHLEEELAAKDARLREVEGTTPSAEHQRGHVHELEAELAKGGAHAKHLEEELAAKDARLRSIEGAVATVEHQRARIDELAAELDRVCVYTRRLEEELRDVRLVDVKGAIARAEAAIEARDARLAQMKQLLADLTRTSEDNESYVRHLEEELRKRVGDIAIRDDEMRMLRTHIERAERTISERDRRIADRDLEIAARDAVLGVLRTAIDDVERSLADREARLQTAERIGAESRDFVSYLLWVLQHPRHRLADKSANALMRLAPALHRVLRPLVVSVVNEYVPSLGPPPNRGAD